MIKNHNLDYKYLAPCTKSYICVQIKMRMNLILDDIHVDLIGSSKIII
jgi:hypothetical protein